jgi:hypothetical protein
VAAFAAALTLGLIPVPGLAQTTDPNANLLAPSLSGSPANPPTFGNSKTTGPSSNKFTAPSRVGAIPVYGSPTGFGAGDTGFDSSNRPKRQRTAPVPPPGSSIASSPDTTFAPVPSPPPQIPSRPPVLAPPPAPVVYPAKAASRPGATLPPPPSELPISNPPAEVHPASAANRPGAVLPIPADIYFQASASTPSPGTPPLNTLPLGAVPQHTLPFAAGSDPYEALGIKAGSFLILPAVELSAGYDNNPQHIPGGAGSADFIVAPELHVRSDWVRHSLTADVTGSYTDYTNNSFTPSLSRPYLNAKSDGRIDVTRDTQVLLQGRVIVTTDNPGSPNLQAGLAKLPIETTAGGTVGLAQTLGRFDMSLKGTFDRSMYQASQLTDGTTSSNDFRNYDQYGGILRLGYETNPGVKPFVEVAADTRVHDVHFDPFGEDRDSTGASVKGGAELKIANWLTGEMAFGYLERDYHDPTLPKIAGPTLDGSILWQATALTTAKFTAATTVGESVLQNVSGSLSRDFSAQIDHSFRTWLIGTLQAGYGFDDYVGLGRHDNRYYASGGVTYKMNREVQLKGEVRHDWLTSNASGVAYNATSVLLTLRLQR